MDKFENYNTGRGSKAHKDYLKKEIKESLNILKLKEMNITELSDRAEELMEQYEINPSDEISEELKHIKKYLGEFISNAKLQ